jgi:hypothetical protein
VIVAYGKREAAAVAVEESQRRCPGSSERKMVEVEVVEVAGAGTELRRQLLGEKGAAEEVEVVEAEAETIK